MVRALKTGSKATNARARKTSEKGRKATKTKRGIASSVTRRHAPSVADLQAQLELRTIELDRALVRQSATADILRVIASSPSDVQPVFEAIAESAARLCQAQFCNVFRFDGELIHFMHSYGYSREAIETLRHFYPVRPNRGSCAGRAILSGKVEQVPDVRADPEYVQGNVPDIMKISSIVAVPMLKEHRPVGAIALVRAAKGTFPQRQIDLLKTFADQAVIAIENTRLFNETKEALEQQTATSEVLKVISSSPGELEPVFNAMLENAVRICDAKFGNLLLIDGDNARWAAGVGTPPELAQYLQSASFRPTPGSHLDRVMRTKQVSHATDDTTEAVVGVSARLGGARSTVCVPMVKDEALVGAIFMYRTEVRPFTGKQIDLVKNFAAQAVIAIENTRLLKELRQRTDDLSESLQQQTATADVLKVISRSAFDLDAVLITLTKSATALCESASGIIYRRVGDVYRYAASTMEVNSAYREYEQRTDIEAGRGTLIGRVALERRTVQITDAWNDPEYMEQELARLGGGVRAMLGVPLIHHGEPIGAFALARKDPIPFSQRQVDLVTTFADQAVIAIQNVRLFDEVQARTKELAASLDDLRTAQGRLIQTEKLASLGQLTAGIAHEIKNPLNFVNNFSALSTELTDELNDILKSAALGEKMRAEVDELTRLLKDNLEKVVQHGKRANSIVKNMLLHSREGSGERRSADINALVGESLNLAYHGARAEKAGFSITLKHDLDPEAGAVDLYPQEITRALLNLISNGFYAATRRKVETLDDTFEPVLSAATRNLGKTIEIRIRDNGTGIAPEVREKIFNPFFTTKPTGEGTGLGLSMTHDIIVKQHGGRINVETEFGAFTEFIITLPRDNGAALGQKPE